MTALPTRKLEAYRYADIDALASVWSALAPPERIEIAAQQKLQQTWISSSEPVQVRRADASAAATPKASSPVASAGELHRVSVGGFADRAMAMAALRDLEAKGYKPFLTRR